MKIPIKRIFWTLNVITIGILGLYSLTVLLPHFFKIEIHQFIVARFDINAEANLPSWYSTVLLFCVSITSLLVYRLSFSTLKKRAWSEIFWLCLGIAYLFLSLDEAGQMHEIIDQVTPIKWIFIYAPLAALFFLMCLYYFVILRGKDAALRNWVIGGMVVYALGAVVCEWISYSYHLRYALQQIEIVSEEGLEMVGTTMVLIGCLQELNTRFEDVFSRKKLEIAD